MERGVKREGERWREGGDSPCIPVRSTAHTAIRIVIATSTGAARIEDEAGTEGRCRKKRERGRWRGAERREQQNGNAARVDVRRAHSAAGRYHLLPN